LLKIREKMVTNKIGRRILIEQPRIKDLKEYNIDFEGLDKNTLGYAYYRFMKDNSLKASERPLVKYVSDYE